MKLAPCAISVVCPVCKGTLITPGSERSPEEGSYIIDGKTSSFLPCGKCGATGKISSIVLAPVGYDGVSEVEWPGDKCVALLHGCEVLEKVCASHVKAVSNLEPGHCAECRWWDKPEAGEHKAECKYSTSQMYDCADWSCKPMFYKDFGCIHFERREG
jgi:hypothetical protein